MNFKELNKKIFKIFTISTLLIVAVLIAIDIKGFGKAVLDFNLVYIPLILVLIFLNYLFRFIKWKFYLDQINIRIPIKDSIYIFMSAFPMTITPGKVGEFLKSYLIKVKYNYPISMSSPVVVIERMTDAIGMLILAGIGALAFNFGAGLLIFILVMIGLGIVIIQSKRLCYGVISILAMISFLRKHIPFITNFYESTCGLLRIRVLLPATILGVIAWIFEGLIIYIIAMGVGADISILYSIFILAFSSIVGVISLLPGGIIASEGSILALLIKGGIQRGEASFITLLIRIATLWVGVALGSYILLKIEKTLISGGYKDFYTDENIIEAIDRETKE